MGPKPLRRGAIDRAEPIQNRLLAALPAPDLQRLLPEFDVVSLPLKHPLYQPGRMLSSVHFPGDGFCSVLAALGDGRMVEVATIGREGAVGTSLAHAGGLSVSVAMVQGAMETCYCLPMAAFHREMDRRGPFFDLITAYREALVGIVIQATACNALHVVEQRLARWLLLAHDRMARDRFPLTQEFVAMMLGATRPTVTVVAGLLQKSGLITYHRGIVTILDRARLEEASCECYQVTTQLVQSVGNRLGATRQA